MSAAQFERALKLIELVDTNDADCYEIEVKRMRTAKLEEQWRIRLYKSGYDDGDVACVHAPSVMDAIARVEAKVLQRVRESYDALVTGAKLGEALAEKVRAITGEPLVKPEGGP